MAQVFTPTSRIQRVSEQDASIAEVFYQANTVAQTLTILHTVPTEPQGCRDLITFATFVARATGAAPYYLLLIVNSTKFGPISVAQGALIADGEQWRPFRRDFALPLEPGDTLKLLADELGTSTDLDVDVYIGGMRYRPGI